MDPLPPLPGGVKKVFVAYLDVFNSRNIALAYQKAGTELYGIVHDPANLESHKAMFNTENVVRRTDVERIAEMLLAVDYVLYHLHDNAQDAISAIRLLTERHYETEKRFLLLSSFMTWYETPPLGALELEDGSTERARPLHPEAAALLAHAATGSNGTANTVDLTAAAGSLQLQAEMEAVMEADPDREMLTEDQYNRRVPHVKYFAWREAEKLVAAANKPGHLITFVLFVGLAYGNGEHYLHPFFKQAWLLTSEGLPIYRTGRQIVPMIHIADLATLSRKLLTVGAEDPEELPELRYLFAADAGALNWKEIIAAINKGLGNGKTFQVSENDLCLHNNVEQFTIDMNIEVQQLHSVMDESDWQCQSGFAENIHRLVEEYRVAREVTPLRILLLGPPLAGKSYAARALSAQYKVPCYSIGDIIAEFKYQQVELAEEKARLHQARLHWKLATILREKKEAALAAYRANREAEMERESEGGGTPSAMMNGAGIATHDDNDDDVEEQEDLDEGQVAPPGPGEYEIIAGVTLSAEEQREAESSTLEEDAADERVIAMEERLREVAKVLQLRVKPTVDASLEPPNPKRKPTKREQKRTEEMQANLEEARKDAKYQDRALAAMVRWKFTTTESKNRGFILDGWPKTVAQARLLLEGNGEGAAAIPNDPEEPEPTLPADMAPGSDALFPQMVFHIRSQDDFLLERLQYVEREHPHNNPEDFQRRLEFYKLHFECPYNVYSYLESCRSELGRTIALHEVDFSQCPLVPPPPPTSAYALPQVDPVIESLIHQIGPQHNFGLTPQEAHRELERVRAYEAESEAARKAAEWSERQRVAQEVQAAKEAEAAMQQALERMKGAERALLEARKAPLKQYLMEHIIPVLSKGLLEVCKTNPDDPVDFLAEWLFRHNPEDVELEF